MSGLAFFKVDGPGPMVFDAATAGKKQPLANAAAKKAPTKAVPAKKAGRVRLL
jgi:hypothetical protein